MNLNYDPCNCEECLNRNADGVSEYHDQYNQTYTTYGEEMSVSMLKDTLSQLNNHSKITGVIGYEIKDGVIRFITEKEGEK